LALASVITLIGAGCSGISTVQGFSPLDFFLPAFAEAKAPSTPTIQPPPVAFDRDLALVN
jgi:hypothetical protein